MKTLEAVIDIHSMHHYRIMGINAMAELSSAQSSLCDLVRDYAETGHAPTLEELSRLMWKQAGVIRRIDWADKFLVVHGKPVDQQESHGATRRKYLREIYHTTDNHMAEEEASLRISGDRL